MYVAPVGLKKPLIWDISAAYTGVTVLITTRCEDALSWCHCVVISSPQWQASIFFSPHSALTVNHISSMSDHWQYPPTSWCWCPLPSCHIFADILEAKMRLPLFLLTSSQFLIQKNLQNPPIIKLLLLMFCHHCEVMLGCPLQSTGLGRVLGEIGGCPCSMHTLFMSPILPNGKVESNTASSQELPE